MENNISQASLLEVAILLMNQKHTKQNIRKLISEVLEMKGLDDEDNSYATQLYIDITTSAKFVYMGNEEWDLKDREPLEEWDKDGAAFNSKEDLVEDDDDFDFDEDDFDEDDDEDNDDEESEEEDDEDNDDDYSNDDDDLDLETDDDGEPLDRYNEDDFDEDKYNNLMDDFEDMYEN